MHYEDCPVNAKVGSSICSPEVRSLYLKLSERLSKIREWPLFCFFASILSNCVSIILNLDISIDCSQFPIFFIISSGSSAYRYGRPSWFHSPRAMSRFHLIQDGRPCITQSARSRPSYEKIVGCEQSSISKVHEKRLYCISKEVRAIVVENKRFPYYIIAVFYSQKIQMPWTIIDG